MRSPGSFTTETGRAAAAKNRGKTPWRKGPNCNTPGGRASFERISQQPRAKRQA